MKPSCLKVGITGGIGSGKSTVCKMLASMGIPVYDADARAKWLMVNDLELRAGLVAAFGEAVYQTDGSLNRMHLAGIVFNHKEQLAKLNSLVHPAVRLDGQRWQAEVCTPAVPYTLKEAALLIESGSYKDLDILVVVTAPIKVRVERVCARDGVSPTDVQKRIKAQISDAKRREHAHFTIDNSGKKSLLNQVWKLHRELIDLSIKV